MRKKQCMSCGEPGMVYQTGQTLTAACEDENESVSHLSGWFCPHCGDAVLDAKSMARYSAVGDAVVLRCREKRTAAIRGIRKKLGLTQKRAAELFGGGVSAFSEYERGKTQPHKSTVVLLNILDKHPELLAELGHSQSRK